MKKTILIFLCFIFAFCVFPFSSSADDEMFSEEQISYYKSLSLEGTTVNVYNWGEYISDGEEGSMNVVGEFERLTGAKVNYTNFESNENMYSKLIGGGVSYDVIIPSDYMIERLIDEEMLLPLDYSNIPNMKYIAQDCKNLYFDPHQLYSVCYNVGTTVLIYNEKLVEETPDSWSVLWDEKYKNNVLMFNNSRDAFAIAQFMLNQDINTTSEEDWAQAAELLAKQKDAVQPIYVMDEIFNLMESGEYAFAAYYAGDYLLMLENNDDLGYCFPKEGVNLFYDAMCVPVSAQNKKGAEAFINFMQEPQVAFENAEYIYYASANTAVRENEESSLFESSVVYPDYELKGQYFKNLPQNILELESNLWTQVKSGKMSSDGKNRDRNVYIISAVLVCVAATGLTYIYVKNKKKEKEQDLSDLY